MLIADTKLVLRLYQQPAAAMSDILDRGSLLFSSVAVLAVSWALGAIPGLSFSFYVPLLVLAAIYVPGMLLIGGVAGRAGRWFRKCLPARLRSAADVRGRRVDRGESSSAGWSRGSGRSCSLRRAAWRISISRC